MYLIENRMTIPTSVRAHPNAIVHSTICNKCGVLFKYPYEGGVEDEKPLCFKCEHTDKKGE